MDTLAGLNPEEWLSTGLFAARVAAMMMAAPFFGVGAVPGTVRLALSVLVAMLLVPLAPPGFAPESVPSLFYILLHEVLIGTLIGLMVSLFFAGVQMAGEVVGVQMGLGAANALDPTGSESLPTVGNYLYMTAICIWFAAGGHLIMFQALTDSFLLLPPTELAISAEGLANAAATLGVALESAIRIAGPALVALLMANTAMAILGRTAKGINVFLVSFPITIGMGFLIIGVTLVGFGRMVEGWSIRAYTLIGDVLSALVAI